MVQSMAQVVIRNINEEAIKRLKARAKRHGKSLEQELREIIMDAAIANMDERRKKYELFRKKLQGRVYTASTLLIREDRDRDN